MLHQILFLCRPRFSFRRNVYKLLLILRISVSLAGYFQYNYVLAIPRHCVLVASSLGRGLFLMKSHTFRLLTSQSPESRSGTENHWSWLAQLQSKCEEYDGPTTRKMLLISAGESLNVKRRSISFTFSDHFLLYHVWKFSSAIPTTITLVPSQLLKTIILFFITSCNA